MRRMTTRIRRTLRNYDETSTKLRQPREPSSSRKSMKFVKGARKDSIVLRRLRLLDGVLEVRISLFRLLADLDSVASCSSPSSGVDARVRLPLVAECLETRSALAKGITSPSSSFRTENKSI